MRRLGASLKVYRELVPPLNSKMKQQLVALMLATVHYIRCPLIGEGILNDVNRPQHLQIVQLLVNPQTSYADITLLALVRRSRSTITLTETVLGKDHPSALTNRNPAVVLRRQGKHR